MLEKLLKMAEESSKTPPKENQGNHQGDAVSTGIKETVEVIEALALITVFLTRRIKDGIGADDAMALMQKIMSDPEFLAVFTRAVDGINEIPNELSDLNFDESITLGILGLSFIKDVVNTLSEP